MSNRGATHPYIGFIVGELKEIFYLMDLGQAGLALKNMRKLLHTVEENAREKENWKTLDKELNGAINARRRVRDADPIILRTKLDAFDHSFDDGYVDLHSQLWRIMWDNGYMFENRFSFWDPSGGRQPGADLEEWARKHQT